MHGSHPLYCNFSTSVTRYLPYVSLTTSRPEAFLAEGSQHNSVSFTSFDTYQSCSCRRGHLVCFPCTNEVMPVGYQ
jgi:hypothetical protein